MLLVDTQDDVAIEERKTRVMIKCFLPIMMVVITDHGIIVWHHSGGIILVVATMTTMRIISLFYRQYHWLGLPITMMITIFIGGTVKGS